MVELEDNELLYMIYQRSSIAVQILVQKYQPIIRSWIRQKFHFFDNVHFEYNEVCNIALYAFYESIDSFQCGKGVFYAYSKLCVMRAIYNKCRNVSAHLSCISLDNNHEDDENVSYIDLIESDYLVSRMDDCSYIREEVEEYLEKTAGKKNQETIKKVLSLKLLGYTIQEIAQIMKCTPSKIVSIVRHNT